MSIVRQGVAADIPAMTNIWIQSFGDSADYVGRFMERRLPSCTALVYEEDGIITSQLFLLPGVMRVSGVRLPALYLYAAATATAYRGKRHMSRLIEAAKVFAQKGGYRYIALVPGESGLYDYYARFGFYEAFSYRLYRANRVALDKAGMGHGGTVLLTTAELTALRNTRLVRVDTFLWDENAVSFAVGQHAFSGGNVVCVPDAWALFYEDSSMAKVVELYAGGDGFRRLSKALLDITGTDTFEFRVSSGTVLSGEGFTDFGFNRGGMVFETEGFEKTQKVKDAYIGLSME